MTRTNKSTVARRREQIEKEKQRQNRIIRLVSALLLAVAMLVIGYFVWQALSPNEEVAETMTVASSPIQSDRPLAEIEPAQRNGYYDAYPEMIIDTNKSYEAVLQTEQGDIRVRLFADEAPRTVNNFVYLANQGF